MMKQLNDGKPLRGFARELVQSKDGALAKRAAEAVLVAGDEGKLLVDEAGQACNKEGDAVELNEEEEDKNLKALETLSHELSEHNSLVKGQLRELHKIVEQLATGNGTMGVAGPKTAVDSLCQELLAAATCARIAWRCSRPPTSRSPSRAARASTLSRSTPSAASTRSGRHTERESTSR